MGWRGHGAGCRECPRPSMRPVSRRWHIMGAMLQTIEWTGSAVRLVDQTKLPGETAYVDITDEKQMHDAIRRLVVRGAPAIGVAAGFGAYLGVSNFVDDSPPRFFQRLKEVCDYLATSRPTAV